MHIVLIILYGVLLSLAVVKLPFLKNSRIKPVWLLTFFWLRVIAGWVHNIIAYKYYPNHGDIWWYFNESLFMKADLLKDPSVFYNNYLRFEYGMGYVAFRLVSLVNMVLDFLSFNNFYVNTLLLSFFTFLGSIALYRVFVKAFNETSALPALLLPSTVFFTACLHKDGISYALLGFFLYYWQQRRWLIACLVFLPLIALVRPVILAGLIPGVILWSVRSRKLAIGALLLLLLACLPGIMLVMSDRQKEFYDLAGNSRIYLPALKPTVSSFVHTLPHAVINGFFQPLPGVGGQFIYNFFSLELLAIWVLVIWSFFKRWTLNGFVWFTLTLVIIQLLFIGYVVPFVGAIVRYRSVFLPFLISTALFYLRLNPLIIKKIHI